jgi:hypothetical protein
VLLEPVPGHPYGLREVAVLAELFRELGEQAGPWILVDPLAEVVDARVAGQRNL